MDEKTANFMISKMYSGHSYYNSPYETSDSCGNCNGAMCEWCKPKYCIEEYDDLGIMDREQKFFKNYDEAVDYLRDLETKALDLGYNVNRTSDSYIEWVVKP